MKVRKVSGKEALEIIEKKEPEGLFYHKFGKFYIGIYNPEGQVITKKHRKLKDCKKWLLGFEYNSGRSI